MLIIAQDDGAVATMTGTIAMSILSGFKAEFAEWHSVPWTNSVIRITQLFVQIRHIQNGEIDTEDWIDRKEPAWREKLTSALMRNAGISTELPPEQSSEHDAINSD